MAEEYGVEHVVYSIAMENPALATVSVECITESIIISVSGDYLNFIPEKILE